ncbi:unnamed protein product [Adineta ricciae]|uniref:BZIP domain-containing protein n=1 Tax=Adineta ricciae TaxID=249248 RepID=A0A814D9Q0_ADIRI|nr:unnamed protein product [Adineta ricciae]
MGMNEILSTATYATGTPSIVKVEPYTISSPENSRTSFDDNDIIAFGPIKVKPRKKPAPTLATGRRSKYEVLSPEEEQKRNIRRARNRAAAERVRVSRLSVEQQLLNQIAELESQEAKLSQNVESLQHQKLHLETRLFTHERMCSNMTQTNASITSNTDLSTFFQFDDIQLPSQQFDTISTRQLFRCLFFQQAGQVSIFKCVLCFQQFVLSVRSMYNFPILASYFKNVEQ